MRRSSRTAADFSGRHRLVFGMILFAMAAVAVRATYLQVLDKHHLQLEADKRHIKRFPLLAYRGKIVDRQGTLLAMSTPLESVWLDIPRFDEDPEKILGNLQSLSDALGISQVELERRIDKAKLQHKSYFRLMRYVSPEISQKIKAAHVVGVKLEPEYRRFYPEGEVTAHLVGFNNDQDHGQEGVELAFDRTLAGTPGEIWSKCDVKQRIIEDVRVARSPTPGNNLELSIDNRLQYLAYKELKTGFMRHNAKSASLVMLDAKSGEVLAMVNQPAFNPNSRKGLNGNVTRNRAVTDEFEPGSTMKPFAVACAMEYGGYRAETVIDTSPGQLRVGRNIVRDVHNYGRLDVAGILRKSSNVGVTRVALTLAPEKLWKCYRKFGFGEPLNTGFPGERDGRLPDYHGWGAFEQATLSFGYGVSASTLQLARAYAAFGNNGVTPPVSLVKVSQPPASGERALSPAIAGKVRAMLEQVVTREGTALAASVPGYRVAGKTGTVKKISAGGGYTDSKYMSLFAGLAPASDPKLVLVVMIDEPSAGEYYGGAVAAPIFAKVMGGALRILNIAPDQQDTMPLLTLDEAGPT